MGTDDKKRHFKLTCCPKSVVSEESKCHGGTGTTTTTTAAKAYFHSDHFIKSTEYYLMQRHLKPSATEDHYRSRLWYLAHLESPLPASEWLAMGIHKPVLKTTLNVRFQKCATHRVVSGVR